MLRKGPLRIGLVAQLNSNVRRTEYLKTATSVAHILNLKNKSHGAKVLTLLKHLLVSCAENL